MTAIHRTRAVPTPQSQPLDRSQVKNSAGGFVYPLGLEGAFDRFLILGTGGGTYYASERKLTLEGMSLVEDAALKLSPREYADRVVNAGNTAPKRTYALYAIAAALIHGSPELRAKAPEMAREVCKTGTDVFELASYVKGQRGWGPTVKHVFNEFLVEMDLEKLALWTVKYRSRHGWTWDDLLRVQHPNVTGDRDTLFRWVTSDVDGLVGIKVVDGFRKIQGVTNEQEVIEIVTSYGLPWEALSDEQRTPAVWKASLPNIGAWAVLRNLATFTRLGLSDDRQFVMDVIGRIDQANRVHPVTLLEALRTYGAGGVLGRSRAAVYRPVPQWLSAIEGTLERSFTDGVESLGRDVYVGLDVSGSMRDPVAGSFVLSCRDVGAALALGFVKNEPFTEVNGFTSTSGRYSFREPPALVHFGWNQRTTFDTVVRETSGLPFGATDCALPMIDAAKRGLGIDTFIIVTDNETWHGSIHPMQALREYRQKSGRQAQLAVVALTSTGFTIADPTDPLTMDFVGFSSDLPKALAAFMKMG
jgi:60 kDa SS-A/Ro ribonucleoprotein